MCPVQRTSTKYEADRPAPQACTVHIASEAKFDYATVYCICTYFCDFWGGNGGPEKPNTPYTQAGAHALH